MEKEIKAANSEVFGMSWRGWSSIMEEWTEKWEVHFIKLMKN